MQDTEIVFATNYLDSEKGWENTNPNWYTASIYRNKDKTHEGMVNWLYENTSNPERHCRWIYFKYNSEFRFRYQREYSWFMLRWS